MTPQIQILVGGMDGYGVPQAKSMGSSSSRSIVASHNAIIIRFRVDSHGCRVPGCWMMLADVVTHDVNDKLKQLIRVYVGQQLIMQP